MRIKKQLHVQYTGCKPWFKLSEINFEIQPDDIIEFEYDPEGYYSENESWEPYSKITIYREEEETEQERNLRLEQVRLESEQLKQGRYESYLKLKQEFDNEII